MIFLMAKLVRTEKKILFVYKLLRMLKYLKTNACALNPPSDLFGEKSGEISGSTLKMI